MDKLVDVKLSITFLQITNYLIKIYAKGIGGWPWNQAHYIKVDKDDLCINIKSELGVLNFNLKLNVILIHLHG
jgi:hypothetical protein